MTMSISPASIRPTNSAALAGDQIVSEVTIAVRASGKRAVTSSAIRSTPGPTGDEAVRLLAFGAGVGRGHHMAAMMAGEAMDEPVLDHPGRAVRALETVPAMAAKGERRIAAPVEEEQGLLAFLERLGERGDQLRRQPASARRRLRDEVDRRDLGQFGAAIAVGKAEARDRLRSRPSGGSRSRASPRRGRPAPSPASRASPRHRGHGNGRLLPA